MAQHNNSIQVLARLLGICDSTSLSMSAHTFTHAQLMMLPDTVHCVSCVTRAFATAATMLAVQSSSTLVSCRDTFRAMSSFQLQILLWLLFGVQLYNIPLYAISLTSSMKCTSLKPMAHSIATKLERSSLVASA